jgi:hypothetical protein
MSDIYWYHDYYTISDAFPDRFEGFPFAVRNLDHIKQFRIYNTYVSPTRNQGIYLQGDHIYAFADGESARLVL